MLIAFDLDGTFLRDDKSIPGENLEAVRAAAEAGHICVPATGRIFTGLPAELKSLSYFILSNGASIAGSGGEVILRNEIPNSQALDIFSYLDTIDCYYDCYVSDFGRISREWYECADKFMPVPGILHLIKSLRDPVDNLADSIRESGEDVMKIQLYFLDMAERARQLKILPGLFPGIKVSSSVVNNIEINSAKAGKGSALNTLASYLDIPMSETVAFGDGTNDSEMLLAAGRSFAVGNASEEVLEIAGEICPSNNDAGVGKTILKII